MFKRFLSLFRSSVDTVDKNEEALKELFGFLLDDYGFHFAKCDLGNAVDKSGRFFFYGPLDAYFIYNKMVCINVLYLVQRQDCNIYITDIYKADQVHIRNGIEVPSHLAYDLNDFADKVKKSVINDGEIYGLKI